MRSSRQWKIQHLIRLAELCDLEQRGKKIMYMEMAEDLLLSDVPMEETIISVEELSKDRFPTVSLYVEYRDDTGHEFDGSTVASEYEEYLNFCDRKKLKAENKTMFSKAVMRLKDLKVISRRFGDRTHKTYVRIY